MQSRYVKVTDELMAFVTPLGSAGFALLKLIRHEYGYTKYRNPWPSQEKMAMEIGMPRRTFVAAIARLQQLGYVEVEKSTDGGKVKSFYHIRIPISEVPDGIEDVDLDLTDAERMESALDPAPIEPIKGKKAAKVQLFEQLIKLCAPALNPQAARKAFMKLSHKRAMVAVERVGVYTTIYNSAPGEKKRYFKHVTNWLESGEFESDESVWRQRAGNTLRASATTKQSISKAMARRTIV